MEPSTQSDSRTTTPADALSQEIAAEQQVLDTVYTRLDELRLLTRSRLEQVRRDGPSGSPQNRSERDSFATLYEDRIAQLDSVEDRLAFGRLDLAEQTRMYIGRIGLTTDDQTTLLTDWRAPAARTFYQATAVHPEGVQRRRHLVTAGRTVTGLEDELLDADPSDDLGVLAGEGALLAAMTRGRTGHMGDIVATIQAEQDAIIRSELPGALVVQGGPGTGKTAVALHRAAYLLYAHRRVLERAGVLLIGPSPAFLRYIDQVLPSLGETGVVTTTISGLFPGIQIRGTDRPEAVRLKGSHVMVGVLSRAVQARQRVPAKPVRIELDGRTVVIRPGDVAASIGRVQRQRKPHNLARVTFVREMLGRLVDQYVSQLGGRVDASDRAEVYEEFRSHRDVRVALNLAWMPLSPTGLLTDLWSKPWRLSEAAPGLSTAEMGTLRRERDAPWTPEDVPLLDELAELLGEDDQAARAAARSAAERRAADLEYARQVLSTTGAGDLVTAEMLTDRFGQRGDGLTTAERAAADRSWAYGHVVVDEAQELSPMAWRAVLRRVPTRSMTIVGDVAQTSSPAGSNNWSYSLNPLLGDSWRLSELTVNYRTPGTIARCADSFARTVGLPASPLVSAREADGALATTTTDLEHLGDEVSRIAEQEIADFCQGGLGRVAIVATGPDLELVVEGLDRTKRTPKPDAVELDEPLAVLSPKQTKGLEFDVVVVVEPARILDEGTAGDLYVVLTRATRRLHIVSTLPLPQALRHAIDSEGDPL